MKKESAANEVVNDSIAPNDFGAVTPETQAEPPRKAWPVLRLIEVLADSPTANFSFAATPKISVKKADGVVILDYVSDSGKILSCVNTATSGYQTIKDFIVTHIDDYTLARIRTIVKVMHNLQV